MKKVAIIGQGYVGLPIAMAAAQSGYQVIGFDLNKDLVSDLNAGKSHIEDIPSGILLNAIEKNTYIASSNADDLSEAKIVVIAVPTPLDDRLQPDLRMVISASEIIGKNLKQNALIINESTSFPGTLRAVIKPTVESVTQPGLNHEYAISPERVDPGNKNWGILNTPRLYSGITANAKAMTREFYEKFCNNLVELTEPEVAEAAKLFENTFRLINISLVNELAIVLNRMNIDTREVLSAAATKPYGFMKFEPSIGIGGHCIPVDPTYLLQAAQKTGVNFEFIDLANKVNHGMAAHVVERIKQENGGSLANKRILIAGVAYKADIADTRETPAENLFHLLREEGAVTSWHDPHVELWMDQTSSPLGVDSYDLIIVATAHREFQKEDFGKFAPYVFDCTGKISNATQL